MTHRDGDCYDMSHQNCVVVVVHRDCLVAGRHSPHCNNHRDQYYYTHLGYQFPVSLPVLILFHFRSTTLIIMIVSIVILMLLPILIVIWVLVIWVIIVWVIIRVIKLVPIRIVLISYRIVVRILVRIVNGRCSAFGWIFVPIVPIVTRVSILICN